MFSATLFPSANSRLLYNAIFTFVINVTAHKFSVAVVLVLLANVGGSIVHGLFSAGASATSFTVTFTTLFTVAVPSLAEYVNVSAPK